MAEEFSKVFTPDQCSLDTLDPARFDALLAGRRLIMFGDSLMRIQWLSLACMLRSQVRNCLHLHSSSEPQELLSLILPFFECRLSYVSAEPDHVSCLSACAILECRRMCARSAEGNWHFVHSSQPSLCSQCTHARVLSSAAAGRMEGDLLRQMVDDTVFLGGDLYVMRQSAPSLTHETDGCAERGGDRGGGVLVQDRAAPGRVCVQLGPGRRPGSRQAVCRGVHAQVGGQGQRAHLLQAPSRAQSSMSWAEARCTHLKHLCAFSVPLS